MTLTPEEIQVLAGIVVSILVTGLLKLRKDFAVSPKWVKIATVVMTSVLAVGFAKNWAFDATDWQQIVKAALGALGAYAVFAAGRDDAATAKQKRLLAKARK